MASKPKAPKEPAEAEALRERQLQDLTKLDEEQNRRIKQMFRGRSGGRAFRAPTAMRSASNTAGNSAGRGAGVIPSGGMFSGFRGFR